MRPITEIIVHCAATPEGKNISTQRIREIHMAPPNRWSDIGYHYVIELDGSIHLGRPLEKMGAHCKKDGHNRYSIGVCYVGGCANDGVTPKDTRTPKQKKALEALLKELHNRFPKARLYGHRELVCTLKKKDPLFQCDRCKMYPEICLYAKKSCPSFDCHEYDFIFAP